jgi:hypothetical protein
VDDRKANRSEVPRPKNAAPHQRIMNCVEVDITLSLLNRIIANSGKKVKAIPKTKYITIAPMKMALNFMTTTPFDFLMEINHIGFAQ